MKPYYQDESVTLYHGDWRELIDEDFTADLIVTDPPYGETSLDWDVWPGGWPTLAARHARSMWCFGSMRMFLDRSHDFNGWHFGQDIIWKKHNGSGFHADRFRRVHEHALHWYRGQWSDLYISPVFTNDATPKVVRRKRRPTHTGHIDASAYQSEDGGPRLQRSVIEVASCHGYAQHPTQKPLGILFPLIEFSVAPGATVLDPFMGSGSTLRAAKDLGRRSIGIEVDERYCEIAADRLAQEVLAL